jgi:putative transposase
MNKIHSKHCVYNISYHIIWIPKYRKRILKGYIEEYLKVYLMEKAEQLNIKIEAFEIMPDHIHIFIKANTKLTISYIVQQLKGYTSYMLRKKFPFLKVYKSLWTHSYYVETIGFISEKSIKKYIELQKIK